MIRSNNVLRSNSTLATMTRLPELPASVVSAAGLLGGFATARYTKRRGIGGAVFAAGGAWCARKWLRTSGPVATAGLTALYVAAMGGSHPLAKTLGPWRSVIAVAAATAVASELVTHRGIGR